SAQSGLQPLQQTTQFALIVRANAADRLTRSRHRGSIPADARSSPSSAGVPPLLRLRGRARRSPMTTTERDAWACYRVGDGRGGSPLTRPDKPDALRFRPPSFFPPDQIGDAFAERGGARRHRMANRGARGWKLGLAHGRFPGPGGPGLSAGMPIAVEGYPRQQ